MYRSATIHFATDRRTDRQTDDIRSYDGNSRSSAKTDTQAVICVQSSYMGGLDQRGCSIHWVDLQVNHLCM